jgi:excisionase family DNA binding protein
MPTTSRAQSISGLRNIVRGGSIEIRPTNGKGVRVPAKVVKLLDEILSNLEAGNAVSVVANERRLSTQQAADLLGVSQPHVVELLEAGDIPFHHVGSHRRVYLKDVLAYKKVRDKRRRSALNRMARMEVAAGTYDKAVLPHGAEER